MARSVKAVNLKAPQIKINCLYQKHDDCRAVPCQLFHTQTQRS